MARIRFQGLVRLANRVRQELAGPVSSQRRDRLQHHVQRAISMVSQVLAQHRADLRAVPGPSRRAVAFLRSIDFERVPVDEAAPAAAPRTLLTLPGVPSYVSELMDRIARAVTAAPAESETAPVPVEAALAKLHGDICFLAGSLDDQCRAQSIHAAQLASQSRDAFAWLHLFREPARFAQYVSAVRRAVQVFERVAPPNRWPRPMRVSFRPTRSLYRVRGGLEGTEVCLAAPFVGVADAGIETLAANLFGGRRRPRQELFELTLSAGFQEITRALDPARGSIAQSRGLAHDLDESFARVNERYFAGAMARPRLQWSTSPTGCRFGHYNYADDTLVISSTLDRAAVPPFVIDHVMHHELLHKKHGLCWDSGRGRAHTAQFRAEERRFDRYQEADAWLNRLAQERPR